MKKDIQITFTTKYLHKIISTEYLTNIHEINSWVQEKIKKYLWLIGIYDIPESYLSFQKEYEVGCDCIKSYYVIDSVTNIINVEDHWPCSSSCGDWDFKKNEEDINKELDLLLQKNNNASTSEKIMNSPKSSNLSLMNKKSNLNINFDDDFLINSQSSILNFYNDILRYCHRMVTSNYKKFKKVSEYFLAFDQTIYSEEKICILVSNLTSVDCEISKKLVEEGWRVILVCDSITQGIGFAHNSKILVQDIYYVNITNLYSLQKFVTKIKQQISKIDLLLNFKFQVDFRNDRLLYFDILRGQFCCLGYYWNSMKI